MELKKPTLTQGFADEVRFVPSSMLADRPSIPNATKRKPKRWYAEEPISLYDGYEGLLVRTVLLRSSHFDPKGELPEIHDAGDAFKLLRHIGFHDQEHIVVLALNNHNQVTAIYEAAIGATARAGLEVRSVLKILILTTASAAIIAHNHPSASAVPSKEDIHLTEKLAEALACLKFNLLDHIIVSHGHYVSFLEDGFKDHLDPQR